MDWARILAYVTGLVHQELLARSEYLAAENRILKAQLKGRLKLSDAEASSASAVAVTQLDGKWRMSQNRDMQDRDGVAKGLGQRGDGDDLEMAELVSRYIVPSG
jgi:predicted FMN-binding regulatory protein PaiB